MYIIYLSIYLIYILAERDNEANNAIDNNACDGNAADGAKHA